MTNFFPRWGRLLLLLLALPVLAQAQSVGIGTTAPDVSAALDIVSSSKGALLPRVASAAAIATPATGLLVFQTGGTPGFYYNAGTPGAPSWQQLATATGAAVTASNGLTKTGANIALGGPLTGATTIAQAGNNFSLTGGNVGIGTSSPVGLLTVQGSALGAVALDVQQLDVTASGGAYDQWQSFTATTSGSLTQLDLLMSSPAGGNGEPGTLSVYAGQGTGGALLTTQAIVYNYGNTYQPYVLAAPVPVTAGQQYTYRFRVFNLLGDFVLLSDVNSYAGGQASYDPTYDLCFKTYVAPTVITNVLTALTAGNVGIGTATPGQKLDVTGNTNVNGNSYVSGNVGVGTATPSQKLEVAGQVFSSTGGFRFPDNTVQTTAAPIPTAGNGLTKTGNNIALGGALTGATTIAQGGNNFSLTGGNVGIGTSSPVAQLDVNGSTRLGGLAGTGTRMVTAAANGTLASTALPADAQTLSISGSTLAISGGNSVPLASLGDNLGNHTALKNLNLGTYALVGNGGGTGLTVSNAGAVGIGTGAAPVASAQLEVVSITKGFLPPRLTQTQRDAIGSPATGLTLYNTTTNALNVWNGTAWTEALNSAAPMPAAPIVTFAYTGGTQTYTVPAGMVTMQVDAVGGQGGGTSGNGPSGSSGRGGRVQATLSVTPGEVLTLYVGGQGGSTATSAGSSPAGYNGGGLGWNASGGGGGATDIRRGGTALANRVLVAGGGGGQGENHPYGMASGGNGGGLTGATGSGSYALGRGGTGGSQTGGGTDGGAFGLGGDGYNPGGGFYGGGGGGGGYYGGGGGYDGGPGGPTRGGAGGGGSSWASPGTTASVVHTQGYATGDGSLTITPGGPYAAPTFNAGNLVNVPTTSLTGPLQAPALVGLVPAASLGLAPQAGGVVFTDATGLQQNSGQFFWNAATTRLGVGTNAPGQKLEVAGSVFANGENGGFLVDNGANARVGLLKYGGREAGIWRTAAQDFEIGRVDAAVTALPGTPTSWTTDLYVSGVGNVGIGTSTPGQKLDVTGNSNVTGNSYVTGNVGIGTAAPGYPLTVRAAGGGGLLGLNTAAGADKYNWSLTSGGLNLSESNVASGRLFVQDGGNVGIGTTSPGQKLDVTGNTNVTGNSYVSGLVGIGTTAPGHPLTVQADGGGKLLGLNTAAGSDKYNWSLTNGGLNLSESNVAGGRLFIKDGGNVGIGTTTPGQALTVIGNICASGGVNCASDGRYKRNVAGLPNALASVLRLRGVTYYWKQAEFPAQRFPATRQLGFIAQEVEPLYPEMVSTDADGYKSVDYARLTPVLVEAIKEQQAQIEALKARAVIAEAHAAQATATTDAFEARLRRLEAPGEGQARK